MKIVRLKKNTLRPRKKESKYDLDHAMKWPNLTSFLLEIPTSEELLTNDAWTDKLMYRGRFVLSYLCWSLRVFIQVTKTVYSSKSGSKSFDELDDILCDKEQTTMKDERKKFGCWIGGGGRRWNAC